MAYGWQLLVKIWGENAVQVVADKRLLVEKKNSRVLFSCINYHEYLRRQPTSEC